MEIKVGKPINSKILKQNVDKKESCYHTKKLCDNLSKNEHNCFICSSREHKHLVNIYGYNYVQCSNCSVVYINNPPTKNEIESLYRSSYYNNMTQKLLLNPQIYNYRVDNIALPKVRYIKDKVGNRGKWFDIGCGAGEILYAAKTLGFSVEGLDTNLKSVEYIKNKYGLKVNNGLISRTNVDDYLRDVHVVSLFGVLEHLFKPVELIKTIANAAPSDSYLVIETSHYPSLSCIIQTSLPEFVNRVMLPPMHLMIYTFESLEFLLNQYAYNIEYVWYFGQDIFELISTLSLKIPEIEHSKLQDLLFEKVNELQKVIDTSYLSDVILIIAKKQ